MKKAIKFTSILLALVVMLSVVTVSAFAVGDGSSEEIEYDYEINYGETIAVTVGLNDSVWVKFVPQKTGKYIFTTVADFVDTGAWVMDSNGEDVYAEYDDDIDVDSGNYGFFMKCKLEAGKAYYLNIYIHHGDEGAFDFTVECGHYYKNGVCVVCAVPCNHELTEASYYAHCECGENFVGKDIYVGDEYEHKYDSEDVNYEGDWFRFVPEESGVYYIQSFSNTETTDPLCNVMDAEGEWIASNDDCDGTLDFKVVCFFESGKTYYISASSYDETSSFILKLERMTHITDEGKVHSEFDIVEETYSNCTEQGYSEGIFCNECEEFIEGHEEYDIDPEWHIDDDWDDYCDLCGAKIEYYYCCECICHSENPLLLFVWRIANFIHSVFGISSECECGITHY